MKQLPIVLLVLMSTGDCCWASETRADFYVSTIGSDDWSGRLAEPNSQKSDGPFATLERARDAVIKRNILYSTGKETTFIDELPPGNRRKSEDRRGRALARAKDANTDNNIYYDATDSRLGEQMLEKQQRDGVDANSLAVDPMFVDPANGYFRLQPDSPALKLGFLPIDFSKIGLRD